jgi:ACT domain-containing protein
MPRRFLTADDVRRANGREIVVDAETLVTPQALEAAQAAGVAIRTMSGPYKEPAPDRGPDSERAMRTLPHLPEPSEEPSAGTSIIVTAVGKNRPGVLAEITAAIGQNGASVHDISQRVIEGFFHLILIVETTPGTTFGDLKQRLECLGGPDDYAVRVMHERVFRFMHRI